MIPVYSLLLVCVLLLQVHTRPRVQRAPGVPHALKEGGDFMHDSGAARREIVKLHLDVIASAAKQSMAATRRKKKDGLLRCARNDGCLWLFEN